METNTRARGGRSPGFLLIGSMKSGTTTLFQYLCRHPQVFMCTPKQPGFFSRDPVYAKGMDWYRGLFSEALPEQICGEASTCYSRWPHYGDVAARVAKHLPDAKLVYLMRHPVDRAYSHYRHAMQERMQEDPGPIPSFEEAIECVPEIVDASLYHSQLEQYLRHFPREQLLCLTLEELKADPDGTLGALQAFLGLDVLPLAAQGPVEANADGTAVALRNTQQAIGRARQTPGWSHIARLLPQRTRQRIKAWVKDPKVAARIFRTRVERGHKQLSPLRDETRKALLQRLEQPTREIAGFLERDLEDWMR